MTTDMVATSILVVEDDPLIGSSMALWLRRAGYQVAVARSSVEALAGAEHRLVGAILLDWHLRVGLSGVALLEALQAAYGEVPIIVVSGDWTAYSHASRRAAHDYLHKPFTPEDLVTVVGRYLAPTGPVSAASSASGEDR